MKTRNIKKVQVTSTSHAHGYLIKNVNTCYMSDTYFESFDVL